MKYHVILLVTLVATAVLLDSSDAWRRWRIRIRVRRVWDAVKKPVCSLVLSKVCHTYVGVGPVCSWANKKVCGKRKRRELVEETLDKDDHLIPLPALFETYDLNGDEKITVEELAIATGMDKLETQKKAFPECDTNGDGFLTHEEFVNSPLVFEEVEDIKMEHKEVADEMKGDTENDTASSNEGSGDSSAKESTEDETAADKSTVTE